MCMNCFGFVSLHQPPSNSSLFLPPATPCSSASWAPPAPPSFPAAVPLFAGRASGAVVPPLTGPISPLLIHGGRCGDFPPGLLDCPSFPHQPSKHSLVGRYTLGASAPVAGVRSMPLSVSWWSGPTETRGLLTNGERAKRRRGVSAKRKDTEEEQQGQQEALRESTIILTPAQTATLDQTPALKMEV